MSLRHNKVKIWYLVLKSCLYNKSAVFLDKFTNEIKIYEFISSMNLRFYKNCKTKLGFLLKFKVKYLLLINRGSIYK